MILFFLIGLLSISNTQRVIETDKVLDSFVSVAFCSNKTCMHSYVDLSNTRNADLEVDSKNGGLLTCSYNDSSKDMKDCYPPKKVIYCDPKDSYCKQSQFCSEVNPDLPFLLVSPACYETPCGYFCGTSNYTCTTYPGPPCFPDATCAGRIPL